MKKIIAGLAMMVLFTAASYAQQNNSDGKWGKGKDRGTPYAKLNLTDEQQKQMSEVQANFRSKMSDLNKNENITVKEQKERRKSIMSEHRVAVDNILTAEQKSQLKEMRSDRKGKRAGSKNPAERMEKMKAELNLSDEQAAQMKSANEEFRTNMKNLKGNNNLDEAAKRDQAAGFRKQHQDQINSILTPEQQEKMKSFRGSKHGKVRTR